MSETLIRLTLKACPEELLAVSGRIGRDVVHRGWLGARSILSGASGPVAAGLVAAGVGFNVGQAILLGAVAATV
jgi:hypothetical protein